MKQQQKSSPPSNLKLIPFPEASYEDWQKQALREIHNQNLQKFTRQTREGFRLDPLYIGESSNANQSLWEDSNKHAKSWSICQTISCRDPELALAMAKEDLDGGVDALWLELTDGKTLGIDVQEKHILTEFFALMDKDSTSLIFASECAALPIAGMVTAELEKRGKKLADFRGAIANDPLEAFASQSSSTMPIEQCFVDAAQLCRLACEQAPELQTIIVANTCYHNADVDLAWDIATLLANGLEYLRQMQKFELQVQQIAKQMIFKVSVGRDFLFEISKLRALRHLWIKILAACGVDEAKRCCFIHAQSSKRDLPTMEPALNLIRTTLYGMAAALGGADSISIAPYVQTETSTFADARRYARNIHHLLQEEANCDQIFDAVGGSYYIEMLTDKLARAAWERLQKIEAWGGMLAALRSGAIHSELAKQNQGESQSGQVKSLIGINRFVRENLEKRNIGTNEVKND